MEGVNCKICGSRNIQPWKVIHGWQLFRCGRCHLGFLWPVPSDDEMRSLYSEAYFKSAYVESEALAVKSVMDRMSLIKQFREGDTILDVGCGTGAFLVEAIRRGWRAKGIEISEWAADQARRQHGLDVRTGDILKADFEPGSFEAITFWDTLEHLPDPVAALKQVRMWLKHDGIIVIKIVNCESYDARTLGANWRGWAAPYHLFHFSPRSLRFALESGGFGLLFLDCDVSTVFLRFLFAPIAMPSHHAKLIEWAKRHFPRLVNGVAELADRGCWSGRALRRLFPGPTLEAVAGPKRA